ncbi:MAG TPA: methyltransferase domain-containing protein [Vicinamibacterales bacterium]|nr:methyltransferase domain-containing protein [Vicinamibacterales bacterium]
MTLRDITEYYDWFAEEHRLTAREGQLEFVRTCDILSRFLPAAPARIVDVGGGAGVYSLWLAERGYEVHLIDATPRLVEEARKRSAASARPIASLTIGDARSLALPDDSADAVLLMGPLYHLIDAGDRRQALSEAFRVMKSPGRVAVAAISRYAAALDGIRSGRATDPEFMRLRDRGLRDGIHLNESKHPDYFTTAFFHRPDDLRDEVSAAGFADVRVLGVEGPGWVMPDFSDRWNDHALRSDIVHVARAVESEPSIVGASAHLLAIGRKA